MLAQIRLVVAAQIQLRLFPLGQRRGGYSDRCEVLRESLRHEGCILLLPRAPSVGKNEFGGDCGRDGLQIDATCFDDATQFAYGLEIEVDRSSVV